MLEWSTEMSYHEGRWFLRGVLEVPYTYGLGSWVWGIWAEVDESVMQKCSQLQDADGSNEPRMSGKLACKIPLHPDSLGLPIEIQFGSAGKPPKLFVSSDCFHPLAIKHRDGIGQERYQKILAALIG
jgi:hypothetical protein